jgi:N-acetylated-alpha-linked acidic dipeptidase
VPSLDMIFDGPYGVYHSLYDDYAWMARFGDPGFRYHAAMSRLWGLLALRFADADLLPLDYTLYATEVAAYLEDLQKIAPPDFFAREIQPLVEASQAWKKSASQASAELEAWRGGDRRIAGSPAGGSAARNEFNAGLMAEERALLAEEGIPARPWFRHLIYAPLPSYEAETLPGLREALLAKDFDRAREQAALLRQAIERAGKIGVNPTRGK